MKNKEVVLIIDDDPALLKMAGELLREKYEVSFASSGNQALELLNGDFLPDLILLDIDMPGMDGFETLEKLHELDDVPDVPVIFLTGVSHMQAEIEGLSGGAVDYVTKPFVKEILLARIKVHIENGRRLRKLSMLEKSRRGALLNEEKLAEIAEKKDLSTTESRVLQLMMLGYTNQEIGEELHYSYGYVRNVVSSILEKMDLKQRSDVVPYISS